MLLTKTPSDHAPILIEREERIAWVSSAYAQFIGTSAASLVGRHIGEFVSPRDRSRLLEYGALRLRGGTPPGRYHFNAYDVSGREVPLFASVHVEEDTIITRASWAEIDHSNIERIYDQYAPLAYSLALRITGDVGAAQDVVQETFFQAWRDRAKFDASRAGMCTWIITIARSRALDALRKIRRDSGDLSRHEDSSKALELRAATTSIGDEAAALLGRLPDSQRAVLELGVIAGMSQSEIASTLHIPLGTVKTRTLLGKKKLRALLDSRRL